MMNSRPDAAGAEPLALKAIKRDARLTGPSSANIIGDKFHHPRRNTEICQETVNI